MDKSSTYCKLAELGIAIQNFADYCSCNVNKQSWKDNQHNVMHVYSHPLKQAQHSYTRKIISTALNNGIKHPACNVCWDLEQAGGPSSRTLFNETLKHVDQLPNNQPRVVIIKPGNTCNMACRMCNPATSTSWYADAYQLEGTPGTFKEYTKTFETIRTSFSNNSMEFWDTLKEWSENLVLIDIYGGEPFLIPAIFNVLEHAVEQDYAKNISININTNASIWNQKYVDILKHFKHVNFKVSHDAVDRKQFEYIRHRSNFEQVEENIKKFRNAFKHYPNITITGVLTITPLNVYYSDTDVVELTKKFQIPFGENIVTTPEYDIRHLPIPVKQLLISQSKSAKIANFLKTTIPGCDTHWPEFCKVTDRLDVLRNQNFAETFPEWWNIIKPYWVQQCCDG
jgi:organic radical activating enzyme